jgi:hypothetical protein
LPVESLEHLRFNQLSRLITSSRLALGDWTVTGSSLESSQFLSELLPCLLQGQIQGCAIAAAGQSQVEPAAITALPKAATRITLPS